MKRKIIKYLKSKDENEYGHLDRILKLYLDGNLEYILYKNGFENIQIYPSISKGGNSIQICFSYFNLGVILEFCEIYYEYCIYLKKFLPLDENESNLIKENYMEKFTLEQFIEEFYKKINADSRLKV